MTTKTHGTTEDKHEYSSRIPSKIAERLKRKRSLDEKTENKRDRADIVTDEEAHSARHVSHTGSDSSQLGRSRINSHKLKCIQPQSLRQHMYLLW